MKKIYSGAFAICALITANSQVFDTGQMMLMTDVSNNGVAVGHEAYTNQVLWTEAGGIEVIAINDDQISGATNISADSKFVSGGVINTATGMEEMARYNVETKSWQFLGTLSASAGSSAWGMSNDGSIVVGLGDTGDFIGRAIKWSQATGLVDMGTTFPGASSRANAVNADGSVIVGWQDDDFDRFGVYWKNGVQTHIKDNNGENVGEVSSVTPDGKTMVGFNIDRPYIWNETDGYLELTDPDPMSEGVATGISDDGKTMIGFFRPWGTGALTGDGFIWTKESGRIDLNQYVSDLGYDTEGFVFALPLAISPNGNYISGIGRKNDEFKGFVIKLPGALATDNVAAMSKTAVYPNPVQDVLYIKNADKGSSVEIFNMVGQKVMAATAVSKEGLNVSKLAKGAYVVKVKTGNQTESVKLIKK